MPDVHVQGPVPEGRPGGAAWTTTQNATLDVPVDLDLTADTVVISGHGSALRPELAGLPTVAEPTAPMHGIALHPLALSQLKPKQAIITGRPTLHRQVSKVLADPGVDVYALTTGRAGRTYPATYSPPEPEQWSPGLPIPPGSLDAPR